MPTNEQRRETAKRKLERQLEHRARQAKRRRILLIAVGIVAAVAVVGAVVAVVIKDKGEHDIFASYDFTDQLQLYGGISNFTDQKPDLGQLFLPTEPRGRFFFVGAKVKLDRLF